MLVHQGSNGFSSHGRHSMDSNGLDSPYNSSGRRNLISHGARSSLCSNGVLSLGLNSPFLK
jgi:hypothetical protein